MGFNEAFCLRGVCHSGTLIGFWDAGISVVLECCSIDTCIYVVQNMSFHRIFQFHLSHQLAISRMKAS